MPKIVERAEARLLGLTRCFTGRPCKYGHVAERFVSTGACIICCRKRHLVRWAADPTIAAEKDRAARHRRERDNPERERQKRKRYYKIDNGRKFRARYKGHAPPPLEKDCPPRPKDGKCECCGKKARRLVLEHDHHTGKFRGWTCDLCNTGLGAFGDSMAGIRRAVQYMAKFYLTGRSR